MMSQEVRDAIENARQIAQEPGMTKPTRQYSFDHVWFTVLRVLQNCPDITVAELRDELEIANNQRSR